MLLQKLSSVYLRALKRQCSVRIALDFEREGSPKDFPSRKNTGGCSEGLEVHSDFSLNT